MRLTTVVLFGTRGDLQPLVALSLGLKERGHEVTLAANAGRRDLIGQYPLDFRPTGESFRFSRELGGLLREHRSRPIAGWSKLRDYFRHTMRPRVDELIHSLWKACEPADALVVSAKNFILGRFIAKELNKPIVLVSPVPLHTRTREFPVTGWPPRWVGIGRGAYNRLSYHVGAAGYWHSHRLILDRAMRERSGSRGMSLIPPRSQFDPSTPVVYGFSEAVLPKPVDWTDHQHVTGFWPLDMPPWQPPRELVSFLEQGPAPVGIASPSYSANDTNEIAIVRESVRRAGQRAVLISGQAAPPRRIDDEVLSVGDVPHAWLFPRLTAVVHHGGAGTVAQTLRDALPSVTLPIWADQHLWGHRLHALGVAPPPLERSNLSASTLSAALVAVCTRSDLRQNASRLARVLRAERGVERAVAIIERTFSASPP